MPLSPILKQIFRFVPSYPDASSVTTSATLYVSGLQPLPFSDTIYSIVVTLAAALLEGMLFSWLSVNKPVFLTPPHPHPKSSDSKLVYFETPFLWKKTGPTQITMNYSEIY
jgi:hypothetical protein